MFLATVSPIFRSTLYIQLFGTMYQLRCLLPSGDTSPQQTADSVHCSKKLYIQLNCSWRWTKLSSETRRASLKESMKQMLLHLLGCWYQIHCNLSKEDAGVFESINVNDGLKIECGWNSSFTSSFISIQPWSPGWQEPESSHVTGMALAHCILGKFLGVVCHCFPPPLDFPTLAARCLRPQRRERT